MKNCVMLFISKKMLTESPYNFKVLVCVFEIPCGLCKAGTEILNN